IRLLFVCRGNALTGDVDRKKLEDRVNTEQPTQIVDKGYAKIASPIMPYPPFLNSRRDRVHRQIPHDHDEGRDYGHPPELIGAKFVSKDANENMRERPGQVAASKIRGGNEQRHKKKLGAERLRVVVVSKWKAR